MLSSTEKSMCNQLIQKWDPIVAPLNEARRAFRDQMSAFLLALRNSSWSPNMSAVEDAVNDLIDDANDIIPGADTAALEDLKHFIDNCELFADENPVSSLLGSTIGLFDKLDGLIEDISITTPEFSLGILADTINKMINGFKFPGGAFLADLFRLLDIIISCLELLCGPTYTPEVDEFILELESLMSYEEGFNVTDNYAFDFQKIYDEAALNLQQRNQLNVAIDGIADTKENSLGAIDDSVNAVKSAMKIGELF